MINGVIFDADGTLLNSMEFWESVVVNLLKSVGVTPEDNLTEILTPMSMIEGAEYVKQKYSLSFSVDEIIEMENRIVKDFYFNSVEMRSGTKEFLDMLKSKNIPITIASATDKYLIEGALKHLDIYKYFDAVISCSDVGEGKSSPKVYLKACEVMGTVPNETLVAEDSFSALLTAKKAGFRTMAMYDVTQKRNWRELKENADFYVKENFFKVEHCRESQDLFIFGS